MLTPKLVCIGVCLYRLFSTTLALASRLSSITSRALRPAESFWVRRCPRAHVRARRSRFSSRQTRPRSDRAISVTIMREVPRDSSISATARSLIEPFPVLQASRIPWRPRIVAPVGKSGPLTNRHELVGTGIRMLEHMHVGVDHLTQVVGRDVGGHAHGDALGPVDEQVREPGRAGPRAPRR